MARILKTSNRQLRRLVMNLMTENAVIKGANARLRQRLEKYEGPEMTPGQLVMPATLADLEKVQLGGSQ